MSCAGHIIRAEEGRWNKRLYKWTLYGIARTKGSPGTRWREEIVHNAGILWVRSAQDRRSMSSNG